MGELDCQRIAIADGYKYPSFLSRQIVRWLFATSVKNGMIGLQFEDRIVFVGSGNYICTIAPPTLWRFICLLLRPDYRLPDYYTRGFWCCERKKLFEFLELLVNQRNSPLHAWFRFFDKSPVRDGIIYRLFPLRVSRRIADHYNTSPEFMKKILGDRLEYTCAFFDGPTATLEAAQQNKILKVVDRLKIAENHTILDVGCGWGQLAEQISRETKAKVTAISISTEQIDYAKKNSSSEMVEFIAADFSSFAPRRRYDRIYSIGMLEHVGRGNLQGYFSRISSLLTDDGLALIHCIVKTETGATNSWIDLEVFPGAYIPCLSELIKNLERSSLKTLSIYIHDGDNYLRTLSAWIENYYKNEVSLRDLLSANIPSRDVDRIMRIWEFYLQGSRLAFRGYGSRCYNVQIVVEPRLSAQRSR